MFHFQISGKMKEHYGHAVFDWQHAYSTVYPPNEPYTPEGEFMSFRHYNVEVRERVKCVNYEGRIFIWRCHFNNIQVLADTARPAKNFTKKCIVSLCQHSGSIWLFWWKQKQFGNFDIICSESPSPLTAISPPHLFWISLWNWGCKITVTMEMVICHIYGAIFIYKNTPY